MRVKTYLVAGALAMLPMAVVAQQTRKIYLDPHRQFTPYFTAALQKKNVPVTVTVDPTQADYKAKFQINTNNGSVVEGIMRGMNTGMYNAGASARVTMSIIDVKSGDVVFSYTCSKSNRYSGDDPSTINSVAECLAKHWKSRLEK
ncbi:MAG: hypothetical protein WA708_02790 [Acidobacteriaceae bacterium]